MLDPQSSFSMIISPSKTRGPAHSGGGPHSKCYVIGGEGAGLGVPLETSGMSTPSPCRQKDSEHAWRPAFEGPMSTSSNSDT